MRSALDVIYHSRGLGSLAKEYVIKDTFIKDKVLAPKLNAPLQDSYIFRCRTSCLSTCRHGAIVRFVPKTSNVRIWLLFISYDAEGQKCHAQYDCLFFVCTWYLRWDHDSYRIHNIIIICILCKLHFESTLFGFLWALFTEYTIPLKRVLRCILA